MNLPEITIKPTSLFSLQYGTIRSWVLLTAVEFKLFNYTVEKKTASEIASVLNTHQGNTKLFLNALCSLDLLRKENGTYLNTELSTTFLVEGKESYLGGMLLLNDTWNVQSKDQMKELIQNGPPPKEAAPDYFGDYFSHYIKDMRNFSRSGSSQLITREIGMLPEISRVKKMLDLGGAHGMDCIAIAMDHADIKGVVFDNPEVVKVTREIIAEYKMEDRVTAMGGDYAADPIGDDYDLIYAKATLSFLKGDFNPMFEKIYKALNPGGLFVSVHDGLTDESTKPADMVISWLSTSLSSVDFSLDREVIPNAMLNAGFKSVQTKPIFFPLGNMDMTIGRK